MPKDSAAMIPADMPASNIFDSIKIPSIQGRRALLILNCQKDAFKASPDPIIPADFLDRIGRIIPYYRKTDTEIVWVSSDLPSKKDDGSTRFIVQSYKPSTIASDDGPEPGPSATDSIVTKKPKEKEVKVIQSTMAPSWTKTKEGLQIVDELVDLVNPEKDIMISKKYWSAFDETPLLLGLRMKMVTDVHICGIISNVSILYTSAEAARHGFNVSVLEDCMGYHNEQLHLEAMQKMADDVGVHGVDSSDVIVEAGGNPPPDADPDMFSGPGFDGINISSVNSDGATPTDGEDAPQGPGSKGSRQIPDSKPGDAATSNEKGKYGKSRIGEGDCKVINNALSRGLAPTAFERLRTEVKWLAMKHRTGEVPRRVAVQGEIGTDGSVPIYRHPADECPPLTAFSPLVLAIRDEISQLLVQPFNHVLIQLYRTGEDHISEHSDKTLDIVRGSNIANVSLGAQRKMTLRIKKSALTREQQARGDKREGQRVTLPHNSVFVLGPKTNSRWLHGVRPDKRPEVERDQAEKAYGGERISLTFRNIGTWTDKERKRIWGQGAKIKSREELESREDADIQGDGNVKPSDSEEAEKMVIAFGKENHQVDFDWEQEYGEGFDALDLVAINPPAG